MYLWRLFNGQEADLKIIATAALGAAGLLVLTLSSTLAQSPTEKPKDNTRVYSYQKKAPTEATPPGYVNQRQVSTPAHMSNDLPYGSQGWWREHERISGGGGGTE